MSLHRKITVCSVLCLSVFMIVICIIRLSLTHRSNGQADIPWSFFWFQIEACVGVLIVSISAFRTLYVSHKASLHDKTPPDSKHRSSSQDGRNSKGIFSWPKNWARSKDVEDSSHDVSRRDPEVINSFHGDAHIELGPVGKSFSDHDDSDRLIEPLQVHVRREMSISDVENHPL